MANDITPFQFKPGEVQEIIGNPPPEPAKEVTEAKEDFDCARENIHEILKVGQEAVATCAQIADQSQSDKYYIALNGLLKTSIEANKELVGLHKTKKDIVGVEAPKNVTNQVIVTSAKMLEILTGSKEEIPE